MTNALSSGQNLAAHSLADVKFSANVQRNAGDKFNAYRVKSAVEETLLRVKNCKGVERYIICDNDGQILRHHPSLSPEEAEKASEVVRALAFKARHTVRDLEPQNELKFLRVRTKRKEIIIAYDKDFLIMTTQEWAQTSDVNAFK